MIGEFAFVELVLAIGKYTSTIWNYVTQQKKQDLSQLLHYYRSYSWFAIRKKCGLSVWISVMIALIGLYFFMYYRWLFDWRKAIVMYF